MKVPLLDLKAQYATIRVEIREAVDRVMESQYFILGPEVEALEKEIAEYCGASYAVGVSSGTDALLISLMALDIGPGDEVITTAYSFFATAGVIARLGATPVFVDIDPKTYNIDSRQAVSKITSKTKAFLPVHLFGRCANLDPILEVSKSNSIPVIEDAAQAIGAFDEKKRQAGTMGLAGCFSFFPSKNLGAFGDGGMVVTQDKEFAEKIRTLRVHGSKPKYHHKIVGGNFRLDAIQAAVLRVKLKHLPSWTQKRRENANQYRTLFGEKGLDQKIALPEDIPGHIYNQFVVRFFDKDRLQSSLKEQGIGTEVYYPVPLSQQECFKDLDYGEKDLPHAQRASEETLALPVYPELKEEYQRFVVDRIQSFYAK